MKRIQQNVKAKLIVAPHAAAELKATMREYSIACNHLGKLSHESRLTRRFDLHHAAYYDLRNLTSLPSQLCVTAIAKASN